MLTRSIVAVSEPLGEIASEPFSADMEKSGPVTVTATCAVCERLHPLEPPTLTV